MLNNKNPENTEYELPEHSASSKSHASHHRPGKAIVMISGLALFTRMGVLTAILGHRKGLYVLVGAGALMTTVGFFGCCGAARESQCLLGAFFACLLVIFAAEITAGVFAFIGKKVAIQEAQKIYEDIYDDYMKNPGGKVNRTIYHLHMALRCCGKDGIEQQTGLPCPENIQLPKSCLVEIQKVIDANLHLVGIVGIAIAGITIFGMIFSMVLCCAIRNTRDMI